MNVLPKTVYTLTKPGVKFGAQAELNNSSFPLFISRAQIVP